MILLFDFVVYFADEAANALPPFHRSVRSSHGAGLIYLQPNENSEVIVSYVSEIVSKDFRMRIFIEMDFNFLTSPDLKISLQKGG